MSDPLSNHIGFPPPPQLDPEAVSEYIHTSQVPLYTTESPSRLPHMSSTDHHPPANTVFTNYSFDPILGEDRYAHNPDTYPLPTDSLWNSLLQPAESALQPTQMGMSTSLGTPSLPPPSVIPSCTDDSGSIYRFGSEAPLIEQDGGTELLPHSAGSSIVHGRSMLQGAGALLRGAQNTRRVKSNTRVQEQDLQGGPRENERQDRDGSPNGKTSVLHPGLPGVGGVIKNTCTLSQTANQFEDVEALESDKQVFRTAVNIYTLELLQSREIFLVNTRDGGETLNRKRAGEAIDRAMIRLGYSRECCIDGMARVH
jgi:hypothetical protein